LRHIALPGWVYVSYSGFEVMHADGRQLQRVGIEPHVRVAPTIEGIRAGRDDVLERALVLARELQPELAESQTNAK
jgi:C-terminal processing protease CtpA/Prc